MNAIFIPDSRRAEVTWIGTLGIVVTDSSTKGTNETSLLFEIKTQRVTVNNKVKLIAKNTDRITLSNGKLSISEFSHTRAAWLPETQSSCFLSLHQG